MNLNVLNTDGEVELLLQVESDDYMGLDIEDRDNLMECAFKIADIMSCCTKDSIVHISKKDVDEE